MLIGFVNNTVDDDFQRQITQKIFFQMSKATQPMQVSTCPSDITFHWTVLPANLLVQPAKTVPERSPLSLAIYFAVKIVNCILEQPLGMTVR